MRRGLVAGVLLAPASALMAVTFLLPGIWLARLSLDRAGGGHDTTDNENTGLQQLRHSTRTSRRDGVAVSAGPASRGARERMQDQRRELKLPLSDGAAALN